MGNKIKIQYWLLFAVVIFSRSVAAVPLLCEAKLAEYAIPKDAFFLPESQAMELQKTLDRYGVVRLKPGGNYQKSPSIQLKSNQELYGFAATKIPNIVIPQETSNAILSGVIAGRISFTGKGITRENCINRIRNTRIESKDIALVNNLFTDLTNVTITIDNSKEGYIKGNRFIRTLVHAAYPAITIIGDNAKQSTGNLFVWTNILTPGGDSIVVKNQKDISFIGIDAESWNYNNKAQYPGMLNVFNTDFLSVFMASGGDSKQVGRFFNLDAKTILLQSMAIGATKNPGIVLGPNVDYLFTFNAKNIGLTKSRPSTQVVDFYFSGKPVFFENQLTITPKTISAAANSALLNALATEHAIYDTWDKPQLLNVISPVDTNWKTSRTSQPDSAPEIQALIDKYGIAELDAGTYYIAKPLVLKNGQGIIGAGMEKTAIVAKSSDMDIIIGGDRVSGKTKAITYTLADITLQGGRNGINHSPEGAGSSAQYNLTNLSHVIFRNMQNSGIFINSIYAWDNNYVDYVQVIDSNVGIMQRPDINYKMGDRPGMNYLDKNVFYGCKFEGNGLAIDWPAKRGNNLNAFINSVFKSNNKIVYQINNSSNYFGNSIFEGYSGKPSISSNFMIGFISSVFSTENTESVVFDNNAYCNSCLFARASSSSIITKPDSVNNFFISTQFDNGQSPRLKSGMIINSGPLN